ncbi:MAG TPA: peptide chain release factor 2 [Candidatus Saccharimonadales bacterium]|nr:peptide chain release factor 2 [Candidatus Saccharimonadales bacterium]
MDDLHKQASVLQNDLNDALKRIKFAELELQEKGLQDQMAAPDFWQDSNKAQEISKQQASIDRRLVPWRELNQGLSDVQELIRTNDDSLTADLQTQLRELQNSFDSLKAELKFTGPFDCHAAIVSIHAGAGGTDAQDWAQMLLRMYLRFAEKSGWKTMMIDDSAGEEAGIKSATFEVDGDFVFGKLKGEHGVHRLVRLSPFNADNLRQTSFAKVEVLPKIDKPDEIELDEKDLKIDVFRSGGHGGQSVNTTDSAVRVTHLPTGIVVSIQNERSQLQNKETAVTILRSHLAQLQLEQHAEKISELKGPNEQAAWGNQIRSYVLHPYKQVKDLRTRYETSDPDAVLDGGLENFVNAYLDLTLGQSFEIKK